MSTLMEDIIELKIAINNMLNAIFKVMKLIEILEFMTEKIIFFKCKKN